MTKHTDPFRDYTSKIKRVNILLPNFSFFHGPSSEDKFDPRFIGREKIAEQLESWIRDKECLNGSYLITGYRGMGKTSFVGKVLNNIKKGPITKNTSYKSSNGGVWAKKILEKCVEICPFFLVVIIEVTRDFNPWYSFVIFLLYCLIFCGIFYASHRFRLNKQAKAHGDVKKTVKKELLTINLNLGSEINGERDILSLISTSLFEKIRDFSENVYPNIINQRIKRICVNAFLCFGCLLVYEYVFDAINTAYGAFYANKELGGSILYNVIICINNFGSKLVCSSPGFSILSGLFFAAFISYSLWRFIVEKLISMFLRYIGYRRGSPNSALVELKRLNDRIESAINEDDDPNGSISTTMFSLTFKRRRMRNYQPATVREIEQALIHIIEEANSFAHFIIVLDELDKIDSNRILRDDKNQDRINEDEELPEFGYDTSGFPGGASSRSKKQNVLYLLAQMKYFISTVKAKFIFISGRELYDAYLADVSDREFSISSIFNGVIYVDSFFTSEESHEKDVTLMAERYLCNLLLPKENVDRLKKYHPNRFSSDSLTLKHYYLFLLLVNEDNLNEKRDEIEKIILLLSQFVTYLTYVSNGAPKKITTHLEKFIRIFPKENEPSLKEEDSMIFSPCKLSNIEKRFYLSFGYKDQQKIGFIHYITFPIFQTIINQASEYSDKLLISSSFLIGHIYKHHANGFSWRNLEYIPELIEMNRTPELRDFINSMISFLKQMYLTPITCGLYHFKFPKRISEEISILSKKYDEVSAIFNFSLDDSRSVKKYYSKLLAYYAKDNYTSKHTLANIRVILGDLHLADEEYTEAICEFRNAINLLSSPVENNYTENVQEAHSSIHIMNQIRAMLKLGLAYEKRKTLDSAYLTYSELINKLINHRYINEDKLGLQFKVESTNNWFGNRAILYKCDDDSCGNSLQSGFDRKLHPKTITNDEKQRISYWMYGEEIIPNLSYQLTPDKAGLIAKLSLFEDLRLAYMPSLAKLFSIEKMDMGGITSENLEVTESEFRYLHLTTNIKDKYIISADFSRKLGDILYYKNGMLNYTTDNFYLILQIWGFNIKYDIFDFCLSEKISMEDSKVLIRIYEADSTKFQNFIDLLSKKDFALESFTRSLYDCSIKVYEELNSKDETSLRLYGLIEGLVRFLSPKLFVILGNGKCNNKIKDCCQRRKGYLSYKDERNGNNVRRPCFACMYYNRSLITLENHVVIKTNDTVKTIFNESKSLLLLRAFETNNLYVYEENTLSQIALTLEAMGNITFTCLDEKSQIRVVFIKAFIELLKSGLSTKLGEDIVPETQLEKAIIYFWTAAKFHKKASNLKESHQCYLNIIRVLGASAVHMDKLKEWSGQDELIYSLCEAIDKFIVKRAIMRVYSNREYTNMAELHEIKWIFSREMYETVDLNKLSLVPDIEEIIYTSYELKINLYRKYNNGFFQKIIEKNINGLYDSDLLNCLRKDSTVYSRVLALHFKSNLNSFVLNELQDRYDCYIEKEGLVCSHDVVALFVVKILNDSESFDTTRRAYFNIETNDGYIRDKLSMLEFLIKDSMFCLTELLEILVPSSKTSLFTNSFIAGVYKRLYKWNRIYETLYLMYRFLEIDKNKECGNSCHAELLDKMSEYDGIKSILKEYFQNISDVKIKDNSAEEFFGDLYNIVGKYNIHYTSDNYLAEMAIKRYTKAIEMHTEGQAYKDFIANFYLLNDDLQNNTCQFYFALERYKINNGKIENYINKLKMSFKKSSLYQSENYFAENNPTNNENGIYYAEHWLFQKKSGS